MATRISSPVQTIRIPQEGGDYPEKVSVREQTLDLAKAAVLQDRNVDYGDPEDNFRDIADMWTIFLRDRKLANSATISATDVAVMCDIIKTCRIKQSPNKHDHWVDKAGYAACGAQCASRYGGLK